MPWFKVHVGSDMAPVFKESRMPIGQGYQGPYETFEAAYSAAESDLKKDINILRRSLAALQRGEFVAHHIGDK